MTSKNTCFSFGAVTKYSIKKQANNSEHNLNISSHVESLNICQSGTILTDAPRDTARVKLTTQHCPQHMLPFLFVSWVYNSNLFLAEEQIKLNEGSWAEFKRQQSLDFDEKKKSKSRCWYAAVVYFKISACKAQ